MLAKFYTFKIKKLSMSLFCSVFLFFSFFAHAENNLPYESGSSPVVSKNLNLNKKSNLLDKNLYIDKKKLNLDKKSTAENVELFLDKKTNAENSNLNLYKKSSTEDSKLNLDKKNSFLNNNKNSEYSKLGPKPKKIEKDIVLFVDEDFEFNLDFLHTGQTQNLANNLNSLLLADIPPGKYLIDISVNKQAIGSLDILFKMYNKKLSPCLNADFLSALNLERSLNTKIEQKLSQSKECLFLNKALPNSTFSLNAQKLEMQIWLPDTLIAKLPDSAFDKNLYNAGNTAFFVKYNFNHYGIRNFSAKYKSYNIRSNLNLNLGLNIGPVHFRHSSSFKDAGATKSIYSYGSTYGHFDIPSWYSQFKFGEISSNSTLVNSTSILGINIFSDEKMLPITKRGFAPEIKGFAPSNSMVVIKENNREIYTTNVAKGEFTIKDLEPISTNSDLNMIIYSADGKATKSIIPYYYIRPVLRKDAYKYSASLGFYRRGFSYLWKEPILSADFEYGVLNSLTIGTGMNLSLNRQEFAISTTYNTFLGSFTGNINFAHSKILGNSFLGASFGASYSNFFTATKTNLTLAAYRYTMQNFYYLDDVIFFNNSDKLIDFRLNYHQKNNFSIYLGQNLPWKLGSLYFSTTLKNYWDRPNLDLNINLGYSVNIKKANLRFSYFRNQNLANSANTNTLVFALSMPFDTGKLAKGSLNSSFYLFPNDVLKENNKNQNVKKHLPFQGSLGLSSASSLIDNLSYSLSLSSYNNKKMILSSNMNWEYKKVNINANASYSTDLTLQYSFGLSGAMVIHKGGINFSRYLSDTFGIVKVKDGAGANLQNTDYLNIESNGYGIIPSLSPYYKNHINLDTKGLPFNYEFKSTQSEIIPANLASPIIEFIADKSPALFIQLTYMSKNKKIPVPVGSYLVNSKNEEVSFVGMAGRAYIKQKNINDTYTAVWGNNSNESCSFKLHLSQSEQESGDVNLYKLDCN